MIVLFYFFYLVYLHQSINVTYKTGIQVNFISFKTLHNNKNIFDVLNLTIDEANIFFKDQTVITKKLLSLKEVGLGYLKLGQQTSSLSGGESQRLKLATFLDLTKNKKHTNSLYILDGSRRLTAHILNRKNPKIILINMRNIND